MPAPRVLLVDDEESLRITLAANLELEGFEVLEADCGEKALELLAQHEVDLLLTDIRMPGINGVELFRRARALRPSVPVVLMTAFAMEELIQSALQEGVYTLLPKPFDVAHAVRTLTTAVKGPVVLVVDDVRADADSLASALAAVGLSCKAVLSGEQAIDAVKNGAVDVCVVDLVMPGLNGAEVVAKLRELDPKLAVIAISGHAVPELVHAVAEQHVYACMRKPFAPGDLVQAIAKARGQA